MVGVHMEQVLEQLLWDVAQESGETNSSYMRGLLLRDLAQRDKIPPGVLLMLTGAAPVHAGSARDGASSVSKV